MSETGDHVREMVDHDGLKQVTTMLRNTHPVGLVFVFWKSLRLVCVIKTMFRVAFPVFLVVALSACGHQSTTSRVPTDSTPLESADTAANPVGTQTSTEPNALVFTEDSKFPQGDSLWRGQIGSSEVMVQLRVIGEKVGGRYYYSKYKRSLLLVGTFAEGHLKLEEQGGQQEAIFGPVSGIFRGSANDGMLTGEWHATAKPESSHKFSFHPVTSGSYDDLRVEVGPTLDAEGKRFATFMTSRVEEHLVYCGLNKEPPLDASLIPGLTVLTEWCHPVFEYAEHGKRVLIDWTYPSVVKADDVLLVEGVNQALAPHAVKPGESWGGQHRTRVVYAGGHLLTLVVETDGLGVGAYPDHTRYGMSYDLRTGKVVRQSDVLSVSDVQRFLQELETLAPSEPLEGDGNHSCKWTENWYYDPDSGLLPAVPHLTPEGLYLTPLWPHVLKACQYANYAVRVPKKLAMQYSKPGSILTDLLNGYWGLPEQAVPN